MGPMPEIKLVRRTLVNKLNRLLPLLMTAFGSLLFFAPAFDAASQLQIRKQAFGTTAEKEKKPVNLYTLTNANGVEVGIMTYGGIVVSLKVPDRQGKLQDVTLGYDSLDGYLKNNTPYFGALIGRYGNRIGKGKVPLRRTRVPPGN